MKMEKFNSKQSSKEVSNNFNITNLNSKVKEYPLKENRTKCHQKMIMTNKTSSQILFSNTTCKVMFFQTTKRKTRSEQ